MPYVDDAERQKYLDFYFGNGIFEIWKAAKAKSTSTIEERQTEIRNLVRQVIDEGVDIIPTDLDVSLDPNGDYEDDEEYTSEDQARVDAFNEWVTEFNGRHIYEGKQTLFQSIRLWRILSRLTGDLIFKFPFITDGAKSKVTPTRMRSIGVQVQGDGESLKGITGWRFTYAVMSSAGWQSTSDGLPVIESIYETTTDKLPPDVLNTLKPEQLTDENKKPKKVILWVMELQEKSGKTSTVSSQVIDLPFLPVSTFNPDEQEDNPRGVPFARRLIDAALGYITAKTNIALSNRMQGNKLLVLKNVSGDTVALGPGAVLKIKDHGVDMRADASYIGGSDTLTPLENECDDNKRECYEAGFVPYRKDDKGAMGSSGSGRQQIQLSAPQVAFYENYTGKEEAFWQEFYWKCATIEGIVVNMDEIRVKIPSIEIPNIEEMTLKVNTLVQMDALKQTLLELDYSEEQSVKILEDVQSHRKAMGRDMLQQDNADDSDPADPADPKDPKDPKKKPKV